MRGCIPTPTATKLTICNKTIRASKSVSNQPNPLLTRPINNAAAAINNGSNKTLRVAAPLEPPFRATAAILP